MVRNNTYGITGEYETNNMAQKSSISKNRSNNEWLVQSRVAIAIHHNLIIIIQ